MNILELLNEVENNPHNANYAIMDYVVGTIGVVDFVKYIDVNYPEFLDRIELHTRANRISVAIEKKLKQGENNED